MNQILTVIGGKVALLGGRIVNEDVSEGEWVLPVMEVVQ